MRCVCGKEREASWGALRCKRVWPKSCGCKRLELLRENTKAMWRAGRFTNGRGWTKGVPRNPERGAKLFKWIRDYHFEHGVVPSTVDVAEACGSDEVAVYRMLIRQGYISHAGFYNKRNRYRINRDKFTPRSWRVDDKIAVDCPMYLTKDQALELMVQLKKAVEETL